MRVRQIVTAASGVSLLAAVGRTPGLLIPFFVAAQVGVTAQTDAFFFALTLAMFITTTFTSASETVVVPFLKGAGPTAVRPRTGAVLRGSAPIFLCVTVVLALIAPVLVQRGTALPAAVQSETIGMLRGLALLVGIAAVSSIFAGALNAQRAFGLPALSPGIRTGTALAAGVLFLPRFGLPALVGGFVAGELLRLVMLAARARRVLPPAGTPDVVGSASVGPFFREASWQILAMLVLSANPVINRVVATFLAPGSLSVLEYAEKLWFIPVTLLTTGLGPVLLTHWVDEPGDGSSGSRAFFLTLFCSSGLALVLWALAGPTIDLVLSRGAFPPGELDRVTSLFKLYLLSMPTYVANTVIAQAHIARRNTKALLQAAVARTAVHLSALALMLQPLGLLAIPAAQAGANFVSAFYLLWAHDAARRRHGPEAR